MRMKRIAAVLAAAVIGVAPSACGDNRDNAGGGGGGDKPYIAIISKGFQHQFWQAVKKGAEQEAALRALDALEAGR